MNRVPHAPFPFHPRARPEDIGGGARLLPPLSDRPVFKEFH
jgi:hypothetical protein